MRRKDDEKARSIKQAVVTLILQEGFHGTSISKIAKLAGVSPATVYIYFENKEEMLQDIYYEYSAQIYDYLLQDCRREQEGRRLVETMIRSYYNYISTNREIFSFLEQFSNCPSLVESCTERQGVYHMYQLVKQLKQQRIIKNYSDEILMALIFYPVKAIASDNRKTEAEKRAQLQELITIIQDAILL